MKIAIVFDGLQIGGIERVGADYARILSELGHDVTVVNLVPNLKEMEKEFPKDCKWIGFNYPRRIVTEQYIDAVPDNFLFVEKDGKEEIRLIDWEYAGMQDPHVDVAMFCIYSLYNKRQVDRLIAAYFTEGCSDETRIKIYCYIAACGLLWSNWCEYKRNLGVEFGEYSLRQYRYAKDYYRIVQEELKKQGEEE